MKNYILAMSLLAISLYAMEKPPQKSPLRRQDSQKGSLLTRIAKETADKGMPTIAKAMLQLDNISPERDKALADLETNPKRKEELLEKAAAARIRNPSPAKESAALQQFQMHWAEALNEMNTIEKHFEYKNFGQIPPSKRSYTMHYQKARLFFIESLRAINPNMYEWELHAEADEKCKPLRKQYEERIEHIVLHAKETHKSSSKTQLMP